MAYDMTTATTISSAIATYVSPNILNYAKKRVVALPYVYMEQTGTALGKPAKTIAFPVVTKDAAAAMTDGTDAEAVDIAIGSAVSITAAEVGIVRDITKLARKVNVLGDEGLVQWAVEDGGQLCMEKIETDVWARFASASTSVGTSGAAFTLANFAQGLSQLTINDAVGDAGAFLSTKQVSDLRESIMTSGAAVLGSGVGNNLLARESADGFVGDLMGTLVWTSSCAATSGANKIGAFMTNAAGSPKDAAIGLVYVWMPEVEMLDNPSLRSKEMAVTCAYGEAELNDRSYVQIATRS